MLTAMTEEDWTIVWSCVHKRPTGGVRLSLFGCTVTPIGTCRLVVALRNPTLPMRLPHQARSR